MAKDRNTFAKRQREVEKKRKADEKRKRRAVKKQQANEAEESDDSPALPAEANDMLSIFLRFLTAPGKMRCEYGWDLVTASAVD